MKTSIVIATFVAITAVAAGVGALQEPNPYQGSETLFNVTQESLSAVGLDPGYEVGIGSYYLGNGSGNGQAAMAAGSPTQTTAPMARMLNNGDRLCAFAGGTNGSNATNASSLVVGLDAITILGSTTTAALAVCQGLLWTGGSISATSWKDGLGLLYGGRDNRTGVVDCAQASRVALVSNWSNFFQNGCANGSATCSDANHATGTGIVMGTAPLWHAWRLDDGSDTSEVFASILGLSPTPSASALHGFGSSPYCNALNWDQTANAPGTCLTSGTSTFNPHNQFIGPGGVTDPADPTGVHRMPPPGINGLHVYGTDPAPAIYKGANVAFDILPTSMQDNDPIRRKCYGGKVTTIGKLGEDVCNIDGSLGLVLPLPETAFIANLFDASNTAHYLGQYPPVAQKCSGAFINGAPPSFSPALPATTSTRGSAPTATSPTARSA